MSSDALALFATLVALALATMAARRELAFPAYVSAPFLALVVFMVAATLIALGTDLSAAVVLAALLPICVLTAETDRRSHIIPNTLVAALATLAAAAPFGDALSVRAIGAMLLGAIFLGVRSAFGLAGRDEALGLGDVKLAAAIGAFLGPYYGALAVAIAGMATIVVMTVRIREGGSAALSGAPFGIGLSAAAIVISAARLWGGQ
jgi:leader peptidase (prepilin peptidase)/N-methyltransferase